MRFPTFSGTEPAASGATSNTPLTSANRVRPDWVRFSFKGFWDQIDFIREALSVVFGGEVAFAERERSIKGFRRAFSLCLDGEPVGVVGEDNHGWDQIDLPGTACSQVVEWGILRALVEDLEARMTRVDLAMDFFGGEITLTDAFGAGEKGLFRLRSSPVDPWGGYVYMQSPKGSTLYCGTRGDKLIRIYQKGRQLGLSGLGANWVRVEVEYGHKSRVLVPAMLTDAGQYFAAAYPWCSSLVAVDAVACPPVERLREVVATKALAVARQQVGRLVATLKKRCGWSSSAIALALCAPRPSDRVLVRGAEDLLRQASSFDGIKRLLDEVAGPDPFVLERPVYDLVPDDSETSADRLEAQLAAECIARGWPLPQGGSCAA